jgi:SAM-dependent methyltransferase
MESSFCENEASAYDFEKHWNNTYLKTPITNLGWYEEHPTQSLELIEACNLQKEAIIFNAGAGATTLIEKLLKIGYTNLVVNDISAAALVELKNNLSKSNHSKIQFVVDDLTNPSELLKLKQIDLWHDRAVLHFFTSKIQQTAYFNLLKRVLRIGGYVILAQFNLDGAKKCSGLPILNYNAKMLQDNLGTDFMLLKSFNHTYIQPSGNTREYIYTLFQRTA